MGRGGNERGEKTGEKVREAELREKGESSLLVCIEFWGREILERGSARSRAEALRFDDFTP